MATVKEAVSKTRYTNGSELLERYFDILHPSAFRNWQDFLLGGNRTLAQRRANYSLIRSNIIELQKLFKERTREINNATKKQGYKDYLEARLDWDQIPRSKYKAFLKGINHFVSLIHKDIPTTTLVKREKSWNTFNTPYPLGLQIPACQFSVPDEVVRLVSRYDDRVTKHKNRIEIRTSSKEAYSFARYRKRANRVLIRLRNQPNDIYMTLEFVHELGHAIDMLETADKGIDPLKKSRYQKEYFAIKYMHEFVERHLSQEHRKILRYNLLQMIAATLFEIDIFTNNEQDYNKAYAKAIRRCFPMTKQTKNPFYVLYKRFIFRPLGELMNSIIEMELYLEEASRLSLGSVAKRQLASVA